MQFEYDPERLIEEVKKRPGIWDYENVNYRTVAMRLELWNEVVRELLQPSVKITKSETRELVLQLQKKWKSLKDSFQKYIHNPHKRTRRPYIFTKQLQFLLKNDSTGMKKEDGAAGSTESDDEQNNKRTNIRMKRKKRLCLTKDEESSEEDKDNEYLEPAANYSNDEGSLPLSRKTVPDEFLFASADSNKSEGEDCDKMFLLSLLSHLKSVPEESRLDVKLELLQVLKKANSK